MKICRTIPNMCYQMTNVWWEMGTLFTKNLLRKYLLAARADQLGFALSRASLAADGASADRARSRSLRSFAAAAAAAAAAVALTVRGMDKLNQWFTRCRKGCAELRSR